MSIFDYFHKPEEDGEDRRGARVTLSAFAANIEQDKQRYPEDSAAIDRVYEVLKAKYKGRAELGGENAEAFFFLSEDRLRAYACIFPPRAGGADVNMQGFLTRMGYEGISHGILKQELRRGVDRENYCHVFPIARGSAPADGHDGAITELLARRKAPGFDAPDEAVIDFDPDELIPVHAGDAICAIRPPEPGQDGMDVTGQSLPCRPGANASVPMGGNTRVSEDGLALNAAADGLLFYADGLFHVLPCAVLDGLEGEGGALRLEGNVCVAGDVSGGASLEASGDVFICGGVRDALVCSGGGSIRVQQDVQDGAALRAARQIQARGIDHAAAEAVGSVFAQTITDSTVSSGGTVNALGGDGIIAGGSLQAMRRVLCRRIGAPGTSQTRVMVGCDPQIVAEWEQNKRASAENQKVMDKLWQHIGALRRTEVWLNDEQKQLLQTLLEQRTLYEQKRDALKQEQEVLREQMRAARHGRIRCHELYPVLEIRLGERTAQVKTREMECDIHLREDNAVLLR